MQDNAKPLPDARTSDPAITTWWAPALPAGAHPTLVDIPKRRIDPPPPPDAASVAFLALLGMLVIPFAWICWRSANEQLRLIERGVRSREGRGTIVAARGVAVGWMILVALLIVLGTIALVS